MQTYRRNTQYNLAFQKGSSAWQNSELNFNITEQNLKLKAYSSTIFEDFAKLIFLPSSSQLRLSMARFLKAPDIALTTRSLPWASSSAIMGRPFSRRTVARMYRPYWGTSGYTGSNECHFTPANDSKCSFRFGFRLRCHLKTLTRIKIHIF